MINVSKIAILSAAISLTSMQCTIAQTAQTSLNQTIRQDSSTLGTLEKDLAPQLGNLDSLAKQFGDPNLGKELGAVKGSAQGLSASGGGMMGEMSVLEKQVQHIPGIEQLFDSLMNSQLGASGKIPKQFCRPSVFSKLLPTQSSNTIASNDGMLGGMSALNQLLGSSSLGHSPAAQAELGEAGSVLPAAIKDSEQENQEIKQLLSE